MHPHWKRNIILFLTGQTLSLFGSALVRYAMMWHVTLETKSGSMMTLYFLAASLPTFFVSPFGGVWADRFNRKYLINGADAFVAFASLIAAIVFFSGFGNVYILFAVAIIGALGQGVQAPTVGALIPQIVPQEHLARVGGINGTIQSCIHFLSPMAGGVLLTFGPIEYLFFIDVITAAIGIGLVFALVKVPAVARVHESGSADTESGKGMNYFHDLKAGFSYIAKHGFILRLFIFSAIFSFFAAPPYMLTPLQVVKNFGADVWRLTTIEITFSFGMIVGGLLISVWGGLKNKIHMVAFAIVFFGICAIALGFVRDFRVYSAIMLIGGVAMPFYNTSFMVLLQTKVDAGYMGRVFGVSTMFSTLAPLLGMLAFGPLADRISVDWLLIVSGGVSIILSIPFICSRVLREAGKV